MANWHIYKGDNTPPHDELDKLPSAPKWRQFNKGNQSGHDSETKKRSNEYTRGENFVSEENEIEIINAALYLRRPLLVKGTPGIGKSTIAFSVAHELKLGKVLYWPITTRTTLKDGLYNYDAIGRLQEFQMAKPEGKIPDIGKYIRLGPLGTALLPSERPRVLLIDEIDKCDIDLPNDLLCVFEEGRFEIPELSRLAVKDSDDNTEDTDDNIKYVFPHDSKKRVPIEGGHVICNAFPFVVLTSNAERELPAPFLRRCLRLDIKEPESDKLSKIVSSHFSDIDIEAKNKLIETFVTKRKDGDLATDQLLNALYLTTKGIDLFDGKDDLINAVLRNLNTT
ncbi:MAG: MoxR family ATPase [Nitrospirae bacterium]|nr:MoxR family ATPase [Nitrospirota bacterium]MBF0520945.1 MoxR family ATPase [Nitrospirota bacterium]MBF0535822.1 MoxR family ATPase [Nitrospirota bacterium]MBF0617713.1 MoxR family ATPase [Nitrospirota bacterium]